MTKLSTRKIAEESLPADVRTWARDSLVQPLNKFQADVAGILNGGVSYADNLAVDLVTVTVPKGQSAVSFGTRFTSPPRLVRLAQLVDTANADLTAAPFLASWHFAGASQAGQQARVSVKLGGLTASKAYKATFEVVGA